MKFLKNIGLIGLLVLVLHQIGGLSVHHFFEQHNQQQSEQLHQKSTLKAEQDCSICSNHNYFGGHQYLISYCNLTTYTTGTVSNFLELGTILLSKIPSKQENKGPPQA